jgi:hypothetical protein
VASFSPVLRGHADSSCMACTLEHSTNISEIRFELEIGDRGYGGNSWKNWLAEIPKWISGFKSLVRLEFVLTCHSWDRNECGLEFLAMDMRDLVGGTVGVDMRGHRVSLSDEAWGLGGDGDLKVWQMTWEWKPKKGQVIDCSKLIRESDLD